VSFALLLDTPIFCRKLTSSSCLGVVSVSVTCSSRRCQQCMCVHLSHRDLRKLSWRTDWLCNTVDRLIITMDRFACANC
jgi:hypothetical protein